MRHGVLSIGGVYVLWSHIMNPNFLPLPSSLPTSPIFPLFQWPVIVSLSWYFQQLQQSGSHDPDPMTSPCDPNPMTFPEGSIPNWSDHELAQDPDYSGLSNQADAAELPEGLLTNGIPIMIDTIYFSDFWWLMLMNVLTKTWTWLDSGACKASALCCMPHTLTIIKWPLKVISTWLITWSDSHS